MDDIMIFNSKDFGEVQVLDVNGKFEFEATSSAKILGYSNPHDAISRHCRWVVKHEVPHPQSKTKTIEKNFISEGDLYRLIAHSELPSAEKFERWIFDDVLPSIRKNGGYLAGQENMTDEEILAKALDVKDKILAARDKRLAEQDKKILDLSKTVVALNETIEEKESQVVIYKERSKYFEEIINQPDAMPLDDIMANFGLSAQKGNRILYIFGVIKDKGDWKITTKYSQLGITTRIPVKQFVDEFGNTKTKYHTYYNQRGRFFIYMVLKNIGIKPSIESNASDEELALETIKEIDRIWKISNKGKDTIYFKEIKDRIKEGFKLGVKEFVKNLKEGNLDELTGDENCDVNEINESDYDMVSFYSSEDEWKKRQEQWNKNRGM